MVFRTWSGSFASLPRAPPNCTFGIGRLAGITPRQPDETKAAWPNGQAGGSQTPSTRFDSGRRLHFDNRRTF